MSLARIDSAALDSAAIDAEVARAITAGEELYGVDEALLAELAPDLIVTQSLCTVCAVSGGTVRALSAGRDPAPTVLELEPDGIDGIIESVRIVARAAGVAEAGDRVAADLRATRSTTPPQPSSHVPSSGPASSCSSGSTRRSPPVTGCRSRSRWPVATRCSADRASPRSERPGTTCARPSPTSSCWLRAGSGPRRHARAPSRTGFSASLPTRRPAAPGAITAVDANAYFSRPGPRVVDGILLLAPLLHADRRELTPPVDEDAFQAAFPPEAAGWTIGRQVQSPQ